MKSRLVTRMLDRSALQEMLASAEITESLATGGATTYRVRLEGIEHVVVTLPDGGALVICTAAGAAAERRGRRHP